MGAFCKSAAFWKRLAKLRAKLGEPHANMDAEEGNVRWCRLITGFGRSAYYMLGKAEVEQLVYVDDLLWLTRDREGVETIVVIVFYYVLTGLSFSWNKFIGGTTSQWAGFELVLQGAKLGISLQRAQWLIRWLNSTVQATVSRAHVCLGSSDAGPEESCCAESAGAHHALLGRGAAR